MGEQSCTGDNLDDLSTHNVFNKTHSLWQWILHLSEDKHLNVSDQRPGCRQTIWDISFV